MPRRTFFFLALALLFGPSLALAAEPPEAVTNPLNQHGALAVWAMVELHFLGVMVVAGSSLLAFFLDAVGFILGRSLGIGDALWKSLFSRLSVVFSLLGLAGLGIAGAYPEAVQLWLARFSPTFNIHMFFGILGLASGYGVLNSRGDGAKARDRQRANGAIAAVSIILVIGFFTTAMNAETVGHGFYVGTWAFLLPMLVLVGCRVFKSTEGTRLTFEAIAALSFMILVSISSSWRGVSPTHTSFESLFGLLTVRQSVFHGVASLALVSLLELAWGQLAQMGGGALGQEFRRLGTDNRWFLVTGVLALTALPFTGYLGAAEASHGSWLLVFQGALGGLTLLALNHVIWTRIERNKGPGYTRTWLWALLFVGSLIVLFTPASVPLTVEETIALAGQENHPSLALWGTAPLKHIAFGVLAVASFDALLCMVRGEVNLSPVLGSQQPRFRAGVWACGAVTVVFLLFGFGILRAQRSLGSVSELLTIVTLESSDDERVKELEKTRPAALSSLEKDEVAPKESGEALYQKLSKSRYVTMDAVKAARVLDELFAKNVSSFEDRALVEKAEEAFNRTEISDLEWELVWFESQGASSRAVKKHIRRLEKGFRAQIDVSILKTRYKLDKEGQTLLLFPLILLICALLVVALTTWMTASDMGSLARPFQISFALIGLLVLFVGAHQLQGSEGPVVDRFARSQQILLLALLGHLAGLQLVELWCAKTLSVVADPFLENADGASEGLRKVETLAALSFLFLLVLGGWAQSGIGNLSMGEWRANEEGPLLLFLIRSIHGYPLGTAVKAAFVLGMGIIVFLSATRFFVWTQTNDGSNDGDERLVTLREIFPIGVLLILVLLYLASESGIIALMFLGVLFLVLLARQEWREFPMLAVFFAFCFLVAGLEVSTWDEVRRAPLVKPVTLDSGPSVAKEMLGGDKRSKGMTPVKQSNEAKEKKGEKK